MDSVVTECVEQTLRMINSAASEAPSKDDGVQDAKGDEVGYSDPEEEPPGVPDRDEPAAASAPRNRRQLRTSHRRERKWKPYYKRSFEERLRADAAEARRATVVREKMAAIGQPLAPYNTTQFLMNDHELEYEGEINAELESLPARCRQRDASLSLDDEPEAHYSSPSDEEEFVNADFAKEYRFFTAERLSEMSKAELLMECIDMDRRVDRLEERVSDARKGEIPMSREAAEKIMVIQREIAALQAENAQLRERLHDACDVREHKDPEEVAETLPTEKAAPILEKTNGAANNSDSGMESTCA